MQEMETNTSNILESIYLELGACFEAEFAIFVPVDFRKLNRFPDASLKSIGKTKPEMIIFKGIVILGTKHPQRDARLITTVMKAFLLHQIPVTEKARSVIIKEPTSQIDQIGVKVRQA
jgi:hypothetical protein